MKYEIDRNKKHKYSLIGWTESKTCKLISFPFLEKNDKQRPTVTTTQTIAQTFARAFYRLPEKALCKYKFFYNFLSTKLRVYFAHHISHFVSYFSSFSVAPSLFIPPSLSLSSSNFHSNSVISNVLSTIIVLRANSRLFIEKRSVWTFAAGYSRCRFPGDDFVFAKNNKQKRRGYKKIEIKTTEKNLYSEKKKKKKILWTRHYM